MADTTVGAVPAAGDRALESTLELDVLREGPLRAVIRLEGELDAATTPRLKEILTTLLAEGRREIVLDMERLYLLDSAALGAIIAARQRVPEALRIQNPSPPIRRVLETTGVARILDIREDEADQQQLLNFGIDVQDTPEGIPVIHLRGELDAFSVSHFRGALVALSQEGHRFIVLHLGCLEFIDSMGLGGLVSVFIRLRKANGGVYLAEPSDQIAKVLRITGLDSLFMVFDRCEEAVKTANEASANAGAR